MYSIWTTLQKKSKSQSKREYGVETVQCRADRERDVSLTTYSAEIIVFTIFTESNRNDLSAKPDIRQTVLGRQLCEYKTRHYLDGEGGESNRN